jgi:hypothetical protein
MRDRIQVIRNTWHWYHYGLWFVITCLTILGTILLRSSDMIMWFYDMTGSLGQTLFFIVSLLEGLVTLYSVIGTSVILLFAIFMSANSILLWQFVYQQRHLPKRSKTKRMSALNLSGVVAAAVGIGCASCGTAILFSVLSIFGAGGLLLWLPLHGEEVGLIGVLILIWSTWYLLGRMATPTVCPSA